MYSTARAIPGALAGADQGSTSLRDFSASNHLARALHLSPNRAATAQIHDHLNSDAALHINGTSVALGRARLPLLSLLEESDSQLFFQDLLSLAWELRHENPMLSGVLLESIGSAESTAPVPLRRDAQEKMTLLSGSGPLGERMELASETLIQEVTRPSMMAGLAAGSLASGLTRFTLLRNFRRLPAGHLLRNPNWAFLGAHSGAFATEVLALHGASHLTESLLFGNHGVDSSRIPQDLLMTAAMLGAVKIGSATFRGIFNLGHGVHPLRGRILTSDPWVLGSQRALGALGNITGLYAYYRIGPNWGLAPEGADQHAAFHTLTTGIQLLGAGALAHRVLGPRFWGALSRMETSTERLTWNWPGWRPGPHGAMALAGGIHGEFFAPDSALGERLGLLQMSSLKDEAPGSQGSHGHPISRTRSVTVKGLLGDVELAADLLPRLTPTRLKRVVQGYHREGGLLNLLLEYEGFRGQDGLPVAEAKSRLEAMNQYFSEWSESRRADVTTPEIEQAINQWGKQLSQGEQGSQGLEGFLLHIRNLGIRGFDNIFQLKGEMIDFNASIRNNSNLRDYYHDLYLVREFLNQNRLNHYAAEDGSFLSELLLNGHGNCVSFSILFSHFASLLGREVKLGVLPNHVYLATAGGGAIETTSQYALLPRSYYLRPENFPEIKARSITDAVGLYFHHMARISTARSNFIEARESLQMADVLAAAHPSGHFHLAKVFQGEGNIIEAVKAYQRYAAQSGENPQAWRKAERQLSYLLDQGHELPEVYRGLAQFLRRRGEISTAESLEAIADFL